MMKYEQDFIYNILPNLTSAVKDLAKELKRYNDREESKCTAEEKQRRSQSSQSS